MPRTSRPRLRRTAGLAVATVAALATAACGSDSLVVGVSFDRPGLGLRVLRDQSGFESELARDLGARLGYPGKKDLTLSNVPEPRATPTKGAVPYDLLVAAYATGSTPPKGVHLVGPYLRGGQDIAVRAGERGEVAPGSLVGRRVCLVDGTHLARAAGSTFPGARLAYRRTLSTCLTELRQGTVDAVSDEGLALRGYASEAPFKGTIRVVGAEMGTIDYYLRVKDEDAELCGRVKTALEESIKDGSWSRLYADQLVKTGVVADVPAPPSPVTGCSGPDGTSMGAP